MIGVKKLFALASLVILALPCFGQSKLVQNSYWSNYSIKNYGVEDGIFSQQVYKIHKDKEGFYWIVSNGELLRFDGLTFKEFDKGNIGGTLYDLAEDREGNMWIPSIGAGLYKFNGDTLENLMELSGDLTKSALYGTNDTLYIGTYGSGLKVINKDSVFHTYNTESGLVGNDIWTIEQEVNGRLWVGTNSGLSIFDKGSIKNFTTENGLPDNKVRAIKQLKNGEIWVGTDKEGIVIFKDEKPVKYLHRKDGLTSLLVQDIEEDQYGNIFIATLGGGVVRFNNGVKEVLTKDDGLVSDEVNTIEISNDGLMLFGSEDGLSLLAPKYFKNLSLNGNDAFNQEAVTLNEDGEGRVWVGTYGQGYRVYNNGKWTSVENPPKFTNGYAQSGTLDSNGNLWVGTQGSGVFEVVGTQFIERYTTENGLLDNYVRGLTFDKSGNIWIGSNKGISIFSSSNELLKTYSTKDEIPNAFCITMITASDGSVWYGSYGGGAVRFKNGEKTIYDTKKGLRSDQVLSIFEDSNNDIWIGTFNYGVSKVVGDSLFTFSPEDGLPTANYAGIIEDNAGGLWFATGNGITQTTISDLNNYQEGNISEIPFHYFNKEDGLISDNLQAANNSTTLKLKDGTLLFASIDGVSVINPNEIDNNAMFFEPYIDEVVIDENVLESKKYFEMKPDNKKLSISYSAKNYRAPNKTVFRIQLLGIDEGWVNVNKRTTAYYDYLPDGEYTFLVSALGPDGQWSKKTASLAFTVLPPFYKTWWFLTLISMSFIGFIVGGMQVRSNIKVNKLNRELLYQQKLHQEKERISRDLHDNVGSQITNLITGIEITNIHIEKGQQVKAGQILKNLDEDARNTMTDLRETIWLLDKSEVSFQDFEKHLKSFIRRQSRYFEGIEISVKNEISDRFILDPSQSLNLMRIIQEAMNNARKYAGASEINISFSHQDKKLVIRITDNGKGMNVDDQIDKGNGLKNMAYRAEEMEAEFRIDSKPNNGTLIAVNMKV